MMCNLYQVLIYRLFSVILLMINIILGDRIFGASFNSRGPMQSKPVDLVPSSDKRTAQVR